MTRVAANGIWVMMMTKIRAGSSGALRDQSQPEETTAVLARVAAQLLAEILAFDSVLGRPWSRSVPAMTADRSSCR